MKNLFFVLFIAFSTGTLLAQTQGVTNWATRNWNRAMASKYYDEKDYTEAVYYLQKVIDADKDTLLAAAEAYSFMSTIYTVQKSTDASKEAKAKELQLIDQSIRKYPNNIHAYIRRLALYKHSEDKTGEAEFITLSQSKFGNRWEMNFTLAYHTIYNGFVGPDSKEFEASTAFLKKTLELNPKEFNTLLLLYVAYGKDKTQRQDYLKKMYETAPKRFEKNTGTNKLSYPYKVSSIHTTVLERDLFIFISKEDALSLGL